MWVLMTPCAAAAVPQDGRARAVAEKHAGIAIGPIGDRAELLRADHEDGVVGVRHDELLRDLDREKESGAGRGDIETGGFARADLRLHETGGRRENHIGGGGRDQDEIDLFRGNAGLLHRSQSGLGGHVAGLFVGRGDPAFLDPGAGRDPLVVGLDDLREVLVGEDFFRQITAGADDRDRALGFSGSRARARRSFHYSD